MVKQPLKYLQIIKTKEVIDLTISPVKSQCNQRLNMPLFYSEESDEIEALDEDEPPPKAMQKAKKLKFRKQKPR